MRHIDNDRTNTLAIVKQKFKCSTQIHFRYAMTEDRDRAGWGVVANYIIWKIMTHMKSSAAEAAPSTSEHKHKAAAGQNCVQLSLFQNEMKLILEVLKTLISHLTIAYNNNNDSVKRWERKLYFKNIGPSDEWAIVAAAAHSYCIHSGLSHTFTLSKNHAMGKPEPTLGQRSPRTN